MNRTFRNSNARLQAGSRLAGLQPFSPVLFIFLRKNRFIYTFYHY